MIRVNTLLAALILAFGFYGNPTLAQSEPTDANSVSVAWLEKIDARDYDGSWQIAAALFREQVTQKKWAKSLRSTRTPLGAATERRLLNASYQSELPGMVKGDYIVFQYMTAFGAEKVVMETHTVTLEEGTWKTLGYFIK